MHPAVAKILPALCLLPVDDRCTLLATIAESIMDDEQTDMHGIHASKDFGDPVMLIVGRGDGVTLAMKRSLDELVEDISHVCDVTIETRKCEGADDGAADHAI